MAAWSGVRTFPVLVVDDENGREARRLLRDRAGAFVNLEEGDLRADREIEDAFETEERRRGTVEDCMSYDITIK
jgi:hypothetical protein